MLRGLSILCFSLSCVIVTCRTFQEQFDHVVELWTLPPHLMDAPREYMKSKCANELISCYSISAMKVPICATSTGPYKNKQPVPQYFSTICDMQYLNCKAKHHLWSYLKDSDGTC